MTLTRRDVLAGRSRVGPLGLVARVVAATGRAGRREELGNVGTRAALAEGATGASTLLAVTRYVGTRGAPVPIEAPGIVERPWAPRRRPCEREASARDDPSSRPGPRRAHDASAGVTTGPERMFCAMTLAGIPTATAMGPSHRRLSSGCSHRCRLEDDPSSVDVSMWQRRVLAGSLNLKAASCRQRVARRDDAPPTSPDPIIMTRDVIAVAFVLAPIGVVAATTIVRPKTPGHREGHSGSADSPTAMLWHHLHDAGNPRRATRCIFAWRNWQVAIDCSPPPVHAHRDDGRPHFPSREFTSAASIHESLAKPPLMGAARPPGEAAAAACGVAEYRRRVLVDEALLLRQLKGRAAAFHPPSSDRGALPGSPRRGRSTAARARSPASSA